MANIEHPSLSYEANIDELEQNFACLSLETLHMYGVPEEANFVDGYTVSYAVTDRVVTATERGYCALRLRSVVTARGWEVDGLRAIMLEYFNYDEEWQDANAPFVDSDVAWTPYVLTVIEIDEDYDGDEEGENPLRAMDAVMLDGRTGDEILGSKNIHEALLVLQKLRSGIAASALTANAAASGSGVDMWNEKYRDSFEPRGYFTPSLRCSICGLDSVGCEHSENYIALN